MRKKVIVLLVLSFVLIMFIFPLFVHVLYKIPSPNIWLIPEWGAADVLQYYIGILTFISTTLLGIVALKQSTFAYRQTLLNENKVGIYLNKGEKVNIEIINFAMGSYNIHLKILVNYITGIVPTNTRVSNISIQRGILSKNSIELVGKGIKSNVAIKTDSQIELSINLYDPEGIYYKTLLDPEDIEYHALGFKEEGAFTKEYKLHLRFNVGLYSGNVVTPTYILMDLIPDIKSFDFSGLEIRKCSYEIDNVTCIISHAVMENEYEKSLKKI